MRYLTRIVKQSVLLPLLYLSVSVAAPIDRPTAELVVIIDDLGSNWVRSQRVLDLPGAVTCAVLPHTPYAKRVAVHAHQQGKEVMLHMPMAAAGGQQAGPGVLDVSMDQARFVKTVVKNMAAVPFVSGINNHMGSQLTPSTHHMQWLMQVIKARGDLYFVDSRTTHHTVAQMLADENQVPNLRRDVFLDHLRDAATIARQFQRAVAIAKKEGSAVAIGHPYPETLALLEQELPKLAQNGVKLVSASQLIQSLQRRPKTWHASLSPLPKDSKN